MPPPTSIITARSASRPGRVVNGQLFEISVENADGEFGQTHLAQIRKEDGAEVVGVGVDGLRRQAVGRADLIEPDRGDVAEWTATGDAVRVLRFGVVGELSFQLAQQQRRWRRLR